MDKTMEKHSSRFWPWICLTRGHDYVFSQIHLNSMFTIISISYNEKGVCKSVKDYSTVVIYWLSE